jgi:hypothetical protein
MSRLSAREPANEQSSLRDQRRVEKTANRDRRIPGHIHGPEPTGITYPHHAGQLTRARSLMSHNRSSRHSKRALLATNGPEPRLAPPERTPTPRGWNVHHPVQDGTAIVNRIEDQALAQKLLAGRLHATT